MVCHFCRTLAFNGEYFNVLGKVLNANHEVQIPSIGHDKWSSKIYTPSIHESSNGDRVESGLSGIECSLLSAAGRA
jgi:hypothetical protein